MSDAYYTTLFIKAIQSNKLDQVKTLLQQYPAIDINVSTFEPIYGLHSNPLSRAVINNNTEMVAFLLENGADIHWTNDREETALTTAVIENRLETIIQLLIDAGADINHQSLDNEGNKVSILSNTIMYGNEAIEDLLIANGVALNRPNNQGWCPLDYAIQSWEKPTILKLIKAGANINHFVKERQYEMGSVLYEAVKREDMELVDLLIEKGADLDNNYAGISNPIFIAVENKNHEMIYKLAAAGADLEPLLFEGKTVLMAAIDKSWVAEATILLKVGANPNTLNDYGWSPLMLAANKGQMEIVQRLLEKGAEIDYCVPKEMNGKKMFEPGTRPVNAAIMGKQWEMFQFLIKKGASINLSVIGMPFLLYTIDTEKFEAAKILIAAGADISEKTKRGETALYMTIGAIQDMHCLLYTSPSPRDS